MAATTKVVTILALLFGAGLLIMMAVLYTQNQRKWEILDTARQALKGPISQIQLGNPNPGSATTSASISVQDKVGLEQFGMFSILNSAGNPFLVVNSKNGQAQIALNQAPGA